MCIVLHLKNPRGVSSWELSVLRLARTECPARTPIPCDCQFIWSGEFSVRVQKVRGSYCWGLFVPLHRRRNATYGESNWQSLLQHVQRTESKRMIRAPSTPPGCLLDLHPDENRKVCWNLQQQVIHFTRNFEWSRKLRILYEHVYKIKRALYWY